MSWLAGRKRVALGGIRSRGSNLHTSRQLLPPVQVARPPKLRVAAYAPSRWEGTPIETLERRLARARCRLQCAGENFE